MLLRVVVTAFIVSLAASALADTYTIDKDHSAAGFTVRHIVSKVKGTFDDLSGTVNFDEKNVSKSSVDVKIAATSINTRAAKRDEHLRSPDFFDVAKFPDLTFVSKKVSGSGKKFKVEGTLKMHGVEKPATLTVEFLGQSKDPWGNTRAGFTATTKLNRKDFGLTWNKALETGGVLIGEDIEVNIEIEAIKKTDEKPAAG